jgi:hypothetical protein
MIISLYENNFPVRFGIVLYSSKYITQLEDHSTKENGDRFEDDISNMVTSPQRFKNIHTFLGVYLQNCDMLFLSFQFSDYTSLQLYQGELWY